MRASWLFSGVVGLGVLLWNHGSVYDLLAHSGAQSPKTSKIRKFFENDRLKRYKLPDDPIFTDPGRYAAVDGVWIADRPGAENQLLQPQQVSIHCMLNALYDEHKKGECAELSVTFGAMKGLISVMGPEQRIYEITRWDKDGLTASDTDDCRLHILTMSFVPGKVSVSDIPTNRPGCAALTQTNSYRLERGAYYIDTTEKNDGEKPFE